MGRDEWCSSYTPQRLYPLSVISFYAFVDACSSVMRKTACNHYCSARKDHRLPRPSFPKFRIDESARARWGEEAAAASDSEESFREEEEEEEEEEDGLHREPSSSGDRLGKRLIVLDCRGGREDVAIHLHLSPPLLSSTPQPSLLSSVSPPSNLIVSHFFIFLHPSTSITHHFFLLLPVSPSPYPSPSCLVISYAATEGRSGVSLNLSVLPG